MFRREAASIDPMIGRREFVAARARLKKGIALQKRADAADSVLPSFRSPMFLMKVSAFVFKASLIFRFYFASQNA